LNFSFAIARGRAMLPYVIRKLVDAYSLLPG
jgi:hypothetical protein